MRIEVATLCHKATARSQRLDLIGAGITNVTASRFPIRVDADLALRLVLDLPEGIKEVQGAVGLADADGNVIATTSFQMHTLDPLDLEEVAGIVSSISWLSTTEVVDLRSFEIPREGDYFFDVALNGSTITQLTLRVFDASGGDLGSKSYDQPEWS